MGERQKATFCYNAVILWFSEIPHRVVLRRRHVKSSCEAGVNAHKRKYFGWLGGSVGSGSDGSGGGGSDIFF